MLMASTTQDNASADDDLNRFMSRDEKGTVTLIKFSVVAREWPK